MQTNEAFLNGFMQKHAGPKTIQHFARKFMPGRAESEARAIAKKHILKRMANHKPHGHDLASPAKRVHNLLEKGKK